jgi:hypothetical protein
MGRNDTGKTSPCSNREAPFSDYRHWKKEEAMLQALKKKIEEDAAPASIQTVPANRANYATR